MREANLVETSQQDYPPCEGVAIAKTELLQRSKLIIITFIVLFYTTVNPVTISLPGKSGHYQHLLVENNL